MSKNWIEENQKYLTSQINYVKKLLKDHLSSMDKTKSYEEEIRRAPYFSEEFPSWKKNNNSSLTALEVISNLFGLSTFEKYVLVLCAGFELDSEIGRLCAKIKANPNTDSPDFGIALSILPDSHWSAIIPESPLRGFRLINLHSQFSNTITSSPIRIEERVLHYLTGINYLEKQLHGIVVPMNIESLPSESQKQLAEQILLGYKNHKEENFPPVQLFGTDETSKQTISNVVCSKIELNTWKISPELIPTKPNEIESFVQLWNRESRLLKAGLYIAAEDIDYSGQKSVMRLIDSKISGPLFLGINEGWKNMNMYPSPIVIEVKKPDKSEQVHIWKTYLKKYENNPDFDNSISKIVKQFDFDSHSIYLASRTAISSMPGNKDNDSLHDTLWESSRSVTRSKMTDLAQRISSKSTMDDLILPEKEKQLLGQIIIHVKNREKVYQEWGFDASGRGLGIAALFAGESGTGKTMAAEVISNELKLDLFRIDLSMVISKYIGETEKNLRRIFDAAEDGGSILFFDEADVLFGKRSEVHDSHDRYANIEVGYLLQRIESYRGLAILATNFKNALDTAFMRRIRFIVDFPFPDEQSRAAIWRSTFPETVPTDEIDFERLSKLNVTGGNIRNIALNSAFLASEQNVSVNMKHLKQAAKIEYDKLGRPLTRIEIGDW